MHRAAAALAVAVLLAEQLGDAAVDVVGEQQVAQALIRGRAVLDVVVRDALVHLRTVHVQDRGEALGHRVAVAAVRRGDVVVPIEGRAGTDRGGLLTDREVGRALVLVFAGERGVGATTQLVDHLLQGADGAHLLVKRDGFSLVDRPGRQFLLEGGLGLKDRDLPGL